MFIKVYDLLRTINNQSQPLLASGVSLLLLLVVVEPKVDGGGPRVLNGFLEL